MTTQRNGNSKARQTKGQTTALTGEIYALFPKVHSRAAVPAPSTTSHQGVATFTCITRKKRRAPTHCNTKAKQSKANEGSDDGSDSRFWLAFQKSTHILPFQPHPHQGVATFACIHNKTRIGSTHRNRKAEHNEEGVRKKANPRSSVTTLALTALFPEIVLDVMVAELDDVR